MALLRIWLLLTAALLVGLLLWAFVPVLVFLALLAAALGIVAALMIALARALRAWHDGDARKAPAESSKEARPRDRRP
jgi:hypothetical protein